MSSTKVNRPDDKVMKEKDVDRKLQFYGIASALKAGKVPSNEQIDIALNSFLASSALSKPPQNLSSEGKSLIEDFIEVIEQTKLLLLSKNRGNLIQDFIWQSQRIQGGSSTLPADQTDAETTKQHGKQALDGIRTLGTLLITNGQFRKLLKDASFILRDIAGDSAQKAVNFVNPNQEQLSQIDRPEGSYKSIRSDSSTIKGKKPDNQPEFSLQNLVSNTSGANIRDRASEMVPERRKNEAFDTRERAKNYLSTKLTGERRDQTKLRLKKLILECQGHQDYQQAISTLLDLGETYASYANLISQKGSNTVKASHNENSFTKAEMDLKIIIERFANGTSTKNLFSTIKSLYLDADQDPELKSWLKKVNGYVRKCLQQKGFIMEDKATEEWNAVFDHGNELLRERYRHHTDQLLSEIKFLAEQFDQDPQNQRFAQVMEKLFTDLGNDENGQPNFKPQLVKDLTEIILPAIFENIRYVPIPRIEFSDQTVDLVVENLIIESDNFFPNVFELTNDNYFRWGRKLDSNQSKHSASLNVAGIQIDLKDVAFYLKKKKGFPSIHDIGVIDVFLGGTGLSFTMKMSTSNARDRENFFKVDSVDVDVKNFKIKIKQSQHKLLFSVAKPILLKVIRPALQKALEQNIRESAMRLDSILFQIKLEVDRATQEAKNHPENATNIYQRYMSAAQKQLFKGKEKTQDVTSRTTVNMAMTKHDSIFPDIYLPGGISSKATEYKELALKGDNWESPIFNLGSASASQNIPATSEVITNEYSVPFDDLNTSLKTNVRLSTLNNPGSNIIDQTIIEENNPKLSTFNGKSVGQIN